ncbi:hypothetical protein PENNAL_c0042G04469, partial [Penicillium nalgiovense]
MPPIRSQSSSNLAEQEVARQFEVPRSTLQRRLAGNTFRPETRANNHKLTETEEESLEKWILSMDRRGGASRPSMVREMANLLLEKRGTTPVISVGENWVTNYIKRRPLLSSRFSKRYNYERAK